MPCHGFTPEEERKLEAGAGIAFSYFPYLSGIFSKLDVLFDGRVETVAVTPSGKLLFDPDFFHSLGPGLETAFVLAHELLHLAQMIFERGKNFPDQESLNIAHDILINELLCDTMGIEEPPCSGLSWKWFLERVWLDYADDEEVYVHEIPGIPSPAAKASAYSLEEMVRIIVSVKNTGSHPGNRSWRTRGKHEDEGVFCPNNPFPNNPFEDLFADPSEKNGTAPKNAGRKSEERKKITLDMVLGKVEEELFPDEGRKEREKARSVLPDACRHAAARCVILAGGEKKGSGPGGMTQAVGIVRSCYVPPWEMAMQRWFDGLVSPKRSWAHASRRGAWRTDVVLPGRAQECYTLHIVLDTSGSMVEALPPILGKIGVFARNVGMEQVHIVQCDEEVTADEFVDIGQLENYRVAGYGGSDMSPAMLKLAEEPDVTSVLVVTDGFIDYPPVEKIPYDVLWCLPDTESETFPYGRTIYIPFP